MTRALSIEDGNLSSGVLIGSRKTAYSDIDLTFAAKSSGEIYKKTDAAAVKQSVKNILLTTPGEKPFNSYFGAGLAGLLFELVDEDSEDEIESEIRLAISNFEPRAEVLKVEISLDLDQNSMGVRVTFKVITTNEIVTLRTNLTRTR